MIGDLCAFAEVEFNLSLESHQGVAKRTHLEMLAGQGVQVKELEEAPPLPDLAARWWAWFCELNAGRGHAGGQPLAISFAEIESWARLTGRAPTPIEVHMLKRLDALWLAEAAKQGG